MAQVNNLGVLGNASVAGSLTVSDTIYGNATSASKLQTARALKVNLSSTTAVSFDGSTNREDIPISGLLPLGYGGTGAITAEGARTNLGLGSFAIKNSLSWNEINQSGADEISEGTSPFTDGTQLLTSWASDNGFGDSNALGRVYRRNASKMWSYISSKISSDGLTLSRNNTTESPPSLTLQNTAGGDTPAIIFQRGGASDTYNDWRIQVSGGKLYFGQRGSASNGVFDTTIYFGNNGDIHATSFSGLAASASRLSNNAAIGSSTQPVYFTSGGVPQTVTMATSANQFMGIPLIDSNCDMQIADRISLHYDGDPMGGIISYDNQSPDDLVGIRRMVLYSGSNPSSSDSLIYAGLNGDGTFKGSLDGVAAKATKANINSTTTNAIVRFSDTAGTLAQAQNALLQDESSSTTLTLGSQSKPGKISLRNSNSTATYINLSAKNGQPDTRASSQGYIDTTSFKASALYVGSNGVMLDGRLALSTSSYGSMTLTSNDQPANPVVGQIYFKLIS